ncbi:MAG TPA: 6-phosphogluconolactonase [Candidatus Binataceae bacterium]|nr:6-phosphogluconolactonase [Candidatus Binataceae bacterium]
MSEPKIIVLDDPESVSVHAAEEIVHYSGEAVCTHGEFTIALAGGSTPARVYELIAERFKLSVDWKEVQVFWGDERCVPADDPRSNYAMANRAMLSKLPLKPAQIHRIPTELAPEAAALAYEQELKRAFNLGDGEFPRFDLIMLGLGDNRHTLSLFPGDTGALAETRRLVIPVTVQAEPPLRVTFTVPVANHAQRVMFVATGTAKAAAVRDVIEGPRDPTRFPAQLIAPEDGEVVWMLDKAAASLLSPR